MLYSVLQITSRPARRRFLTEFRPRTDLPAPEGYTILAAMDRRGRGEIRGCLKPRFDAASAWVLGGFPPGPEYPRGANFGCLLRGAGFAGARLSGLDTTNATSRLAAGDHRGRGVEIGLTSERRWWHRIRGSGRNRRNRHTETRSPAMARTSVGAIGLAGALSQWLGAGDFRPPRLAYEYPTIDALAKHWPVRPTGGQRITTSKSNETSSRTLRRFLLGPIANCRGSDCRFPSADSPNEFWDLLNRGDDATGECHTATGNSHGRWRRNRIS